jgi:hypothetical protein
MHAPYLPTAPFLGRLSAYHDNAKQLMADHDCSTILFVHHYHVHFIPV